jgi:hypothetical protein
MAAKAKTIALVLLLVFGVLLGGLGVFLIIKWRKILKDEGSPNKINMSDTYSKLD